EIRRQIPADLFPFTAAIIAPHHVPMLLHEQHIRPRWMHRHMMHAVPHLSIRIRDVLRAQPFIDRPPRRSTIVSPKRPCSRNRDIYAPRILSVQQNRVEPHAARTRRPTIAGAVRPQPRKLGPTLAAIFTLE